jgi:hypothetical protein
MSVDVTSPWAWAGVAVLVAAAVVWLRYEARHAADDMDPPPTAPWPDEEWDDPFDMRVTAYDPAYDPRHLYGSGSRRELDHPAVEADILAALEAEFDDDGRTA